MTSSPNTDMVWKKLVSGRSVRLPITVVALVVLWLLVPRPSSVVLPHQSPDSALVDPVDSSSYTYPFLDPSLSWDTRADDLVSRLTLDEMTEQMARGGKTTHAPGIDRLGIRPYVWGSECLHGDGAAGPATSFPQAIGLAATFSQEVIFNVSRATGLEVRSKYNNYSSHDYFGVHTSASCWSPVINIARDPRWGRNQETYGEDPFLTGELTVAFVKGLQGNHSRYVMANAGCKHYAVHAGPDNIPLTKHRFDAKVTEEDLRNTFLPAFRKCVKAGTYSFMCSYNRVNGAPACASKKLLTDILREEWGFKGYVISDCGAIEDIMDQHKYVETMEDAAAVAVIAGTNLEDGPGKRIPYFSAISSAVHQGKLNESTVREAVKPLFYTRMRLGLFDPPGMVPYSQLNITDYVQVKPHRELAITSALRSFVLLKNEDNLLPLSGKAVGKPFRKVAVVGPMAANVRGMMGAYAPRPDAQYVLTPAQGLTGLGDYHTYHAGCVRSDTECLDYDQKAIEEAVTGANFVVVCLGTGIHLENNGVDRTGINLPENQLQLLKDATLHAGDSPVVLLLFNAGPLDISWAVSSSSVKVIIECFFPAQGTGQALYRMFLNEGEASNPAGRLPMTWPTSLDQYPPITDYSMMNRTYRYMTNPPLYPFGYGLSYTSFQYISLSLQTRSVLKAGILGVQVTVSNTGSYDGEEVVQLYVTWPHQKMPSTPNIQLIGFGRYFIPSGKQLNCSLTVAVEELSLWDDNQGKFVVVPGEYTMYAGGQQPHQKVAVPSNILQDKFTVPG